MHQSQASSATSTRQRHRTAQHSATQRHHCQRLLSRPTDRRHAIHEDTSDPLAGVSGAQRQHPSDEERRCDWPVRRNGRPRLWFAGKALAPSASSDPSAPGKARYVKQQHRHHVLSIAGTSAEAALVPAIWSVRQLSARPDALRAAREATATLTGPALAHEQ